MTTTVTTDSTPDIVRLKDRLKATWMAGNYDYFSRFLERSAVELLDRVDDRVHLAEGPRLLDVACGSGQVALIAARRGARVTGVDIAPNAIAAARGRARAEGIHARFDEGDAESLPYADASFDAVTTLYGAMFAPRPDLVAAELTRVCRPGGTIVMGNWNAGGFVGQMFRILGRFIAPNGMPSPILWGDEETVRARFGERVSNLRMTRVTFRFDYPFGPGGVVEHFRDYYGPTNRAFANLQAGDQQALHEALVDLWRSANLSDDPKRTIVDAAYLQVVAARA